MCLVSYRQNYWLIGKLISTPWQEINWIQRNFQQIPSASKRHSRHTLYVIQPGRQGNESRDIDFHFDNSTREH